MLAAGLIIAVAIERVATGTGQWQYAEGMPRVVGVGLAVYPLNIESFRHGLMWGEV